MNFGRCKSPRGCQTALHCNRADACCADLLHQRDVDGMDSAMVALELANDNARGIAGAVGLAVKAPNRPVFRGALNGPTLKFKRLDPRAVLPEYQTADAACFDLVAIDAGRVVPGDPTTFRTGWAVEIPEGFVLMIYSRSGHGFNHSTRLANCTGVIDSDYRGELLVRLTCDDFVGGMRVRAGDRVAQAMLMPAPQSPLIEVAEMSETQRGYAGFGSTGGW